MLKSKLIKVKRGWSELIPSSISVQHTFLVREGKNNKEIPFKLASSKEGTYIRVGGSVKDKSCKILVEYKRLKEGKEIKEVARPWVVTAWPLPETPGIRTTN